MIPENGNTDNRKWRFPLASQLSLLGGYFFIIALMVFMGRILFISSDIVSEYESRLSRALVDLTDPVLDDNRKEDIIIGINDLITQSPFRDISGQREYQTGRIIPVIPGPDNSRGTIQNLGELILWTCTYGEAQSRSLKILFLSFIGLNIILFVIVSISEYNARRRLDRERMEKEMDRNLVEILEREKNTLSMELHDDVAQKLTVIKSIVSNRNDGNSDLAVRYTNDVIARVRSLSQGLRTPDLSSGIFSDSLSFLYSDYRSISNIELRVTHQGLSALSLDRNQLLHIYRIIQELLSNSWKHSRAEWVELRLFYSHPLFSIRYRDNGVGMDAKEGKIGLGLSGLRQRTEILGGEISLESPEDRGVEIFITISCEL